MDNLFLLLAFASLIAFVVALIKPSSFKKIFKDKATRKNLSIYFIGSTIIFFVLFGIITDTSTTANINEQNDQEVTEADQQTIMNKKTETIPVIFDVPTLLDKNISYFAPVFGEPINENPEPTNIAIEAGLETWTKRFEKDGYAIAVTYEIDNGKVTEIFLSKGTYDIPLKETWITKNEVDDLLKRGNISKDISGYHYIFMWSVQDKSKYTGIAVQKEPFTGFEGDQLCNGYPEC